jgi:hypothetical protein
MRREYALKRAVQGKAKELKWGEFDFIETELE